MTRVVSSSSTRCVQSVTPYVDLTGGEPRLEDGLSEEDATAESVLGVVDDLLHGDESALLCSHRPVLPAVFDALGLDDAQLDPAGLVVVHVRKGKVVATESPPDDLSQGPPALFT